MAFFGIGVSCPGGSIPCNGNGQCDLTNGHCICNSLTVGSDCSGNLYNLSNFLLVKAELGFCMMPWSITLLHYIYYSSYAC